MKVARQAWILSSVARNLRLALGALLAVVYGVLLLPQASAQPIQGAGSTFAAPVISEWAKAYEMAREDGGDFFTLDWNVDYEPVGSLAGLMRLDQPELDFAATDVPVSPQDLERLGRLQFPIVMGGIAIVANLEGVEPGILRLSGSVLADIYLGRITNWSDPALVALNPDLALPDLAITPLHRIDGSGSTFVFTEFLTATSPDWSGAHGANTLMDWPVGDGAEGTSDLLALVARTTGAIAYAEYGQVLRSGLPFAAMQNPAGNFVLPDPAGVQAAANAIDWAVTTDFYASLTNKTGADAYPLSTTTFAVVQVAGRNAVRYRRVRDLFRLALTEGAADATALGYVPLPSALVEQIEQYWTSRF